MQMAWSAKRTCELYRSASEYTATVWMPSSLQALMTRTAISPRLAMRIFLNRPDGKQSLPVFHRLAVHDQPAFHDAGHFGLDLVHQLHRFDDAQDFAGLNTLAHADEGRRIWGGALIEGSDNGRFDQNQVGVRRLFAGRLKRPCRSGGIAGRGAGPRTRSG